MNGIAIQIDDLDEIEVEKLKLLESGSAIVCRICQLTEEEMGEALVTTGCRCNGDLGFVHRQCLQTWVNTRNCVCCEICLTKFTSKVHLPEHMRFVPFQFRTPSYFSNEPSAVNKRNWFLVSIFLILACIGISCYMITVSTQELRDFQKKNLTSEDHTFVKVNLFNYGYNDDIANDLFKSINITLKQGDYENRVTSCYEFLVLSIVILFFVVASWLITELFLWPDEELNAELLNMSTRGVYLNRHHRVAQYTNFMDEDNYHFY